MKIYWGTLIFGVFLAIGGFIGGHFFGLFGSNSYRVGWAFSMLGISTTTVYYFLKDRMEQKGSGLMDRGKQAMTGGGGGAAPAQAESGGTGEVDLLVKDAEARLAASKLAQGGHIGTLPVFFLLGESGSVKTTTMVQSGLEPELLAGHIYQENQIVPTRTANLWFAKKGVFVEGGGPLMNDQRTWQRLLKKLQPRKLKSVMGGAKQAPRAAILCVDLERFLQPNASDAMASAGRLVQARLGEISAQFGISFPVYVLFTRSDRVPFFAEYVRNLSNEESSQVFGATLPMRNISGVYAERETQRLNQYFTELFYSLCDHRIDYLPREHDAEKLPACYEFPREYRKLRGALVQFLVDVGRPSQLRASPFLRGFYFTGVRPIIISDVAQPTFQRAAQQRYDPRESATQMFNVGMLRQTEPTMPAPQAQQQGRKVPQWLFLSHFFNDIVLEDRAAMGASGASTKASFLQRLLLGFVSAMALIWIIGMMVSYSNNKELETTVIEAAKNIPPTQVRGGELPRVDDLERLEKLRQSVELLSRYNREGAPLSYRWGLYVGNSIYPLARRIYFQCFYRLMFGETQSRLLTWLQRLPATPGPTDDYVYSYNTLKGYLETTQYHEKAARDFLPPLMMERWSEKRDTSALSTLAAKQFDFYTDELIIENPYSSSKDEPAVDRARRYLASFGGYERIYNNMLLEANKKFPTVNYNKSFPNARGIVTNDKDVPGAFTKDGWAFFQDALKRVPQFYGGEEWVLETKKYKQAEVDLGKVEQQIRERYTSDFIAAWKAYINATSVFRYSNLNDAARKLDEQSRAQSPILAVFALCTRNAVVEPKEDAYAKRVRDALQPVLQIVPEGQQAFIGPTNTGYANGLVSLQQAIAQAAAAPRLDDPTISATKAVAQSAHGAARQVAYAFRPDADIGRKSGTLLEDPITYAEGFLRGAGPAELNQKGGELCKAFDLMTNKFPFKTRAIPEVTIPELTDFVRPGTGRIYTFYEENLKNFLIKQGRDYVESPSGNIRLNPRFVQFFNEVVRFGEAVYPGGRQEPYFTYTLQPGASEFVQFTSLTIDGQSAANLSPTMATEFKWTGSPNGSVRLDGKILGGSPASIQRWPQSNQSGTWAVFRFFADSDRFAELGNSRFSLTWVPRSGAGGTTVQTADGRDVTYTFILDTRGAPPIFHKEYLQNLRCIPQVATGSK